MNLICKDGTEFEIPAGLAEELGRVYRGLNLQKEFAKMSLWLQANPKRRKSRAGCMRFIVNWLNKAQPEIAATLPKCVRCRLNPAMHAHNGASYCTPCLAAVVGTRDSEPKRLGTLLDKLVRA